MNSINELLTKEYMARLERYTLDIKRKIQNTGYSGTRKSNAKGSSMEFSDFREYSLGDDFRRIDWNSYARFDKLFMKLFMEEKQATVNIFLDTSTSMSAHEKKCQYSKMIAASISYVTLHNTDRLNIFGCGNGITARKDNIQSKNVFLDVVRFLDQLEYGSDTMLTASVTEAAKRHMGRGISIIISDFFSSDGYEDAVKALQYKKQDIILVQIFSEEEKNPDFTGSIRLIDSETGENKDIELTASMIEEYKRARITYENEISEFCFKRGVKFVNLCTDISLMKGINKIL